MKKYAIVSGGAGGIGRATVEKLCQDNNIDTVFVLDIVKPCYKLSKVAYYFCDLLDIIAIKTVVSTILQKIPHVDILVSSAGVHHTATIEKTLTSDYFRVLNTNVTGTFFLLQYVLPVMREQKRGAVVLVGSDQSVIGKRHSAVYGLTKAAIGQLAKSTALDYACYGIRVNCVCPGTIDTPLYQRALYHTKNPEKQAQQEANKQPLKRIGKAYEVANLIVFLCSDQAQYITGALFPIDGGYTAQ